MKNNQFCLSNYTVFGIGINSVINLPELARTTIEPDVFIRISSEDFAYPDNKNRQCYGKYSIEEAILSFKGVGSFRIRGGTDIDVWKEPSADDRLVRMFLHGIVTAILLHQRGFFVLHGSCMKIGYRAVGFLGPSGAGKSTIAALLHQRGHDILSEDIVAINFSTGMPITYPGIPQLKLTENAIASLKLPFQPVESLYPLSNEFIYRYARELTSTCIDMSGIFIITDSDQINIQPLSQHDAFVALLRNSYTAKLLEPTHSQGSHFKQCTQLIDKIPIYLLERPRDLNVMAEVISNIEKMSYD